MTEHKDMGHSAFHYQKHTLPKKKDSELLPDEVEEMKREIEENMQKVGYYSTRVDHDDGNIVYEIHGPNDTFIVFEGLNAKSQCGIMLEALTRTDQATVTIPRDVLEGMKIEPAITDGVKGYNKALKELLEEY